MKSHERLVLATVCFLLIIRALCEKTCRNLDLGLAV